MRDMVDAKIKTHIMYMNIYKSFSILNPITVLIGNIGFLLKHIVYTILLEVKNIPKGLIAAVTWQYKLLFQNNYISSYFSYSCSN